jgi:hypothetical protein
MLQKPENTQKWRLKMVKIKEMPYKEKYGMVLSNMKIEGPGMAFIEKQLGKQAVTDLQQEFQKGIKPIPKNASDKEKYEIASSNLSWMGGTKYSFVKSRLGDEGINQCIRVDVGFLKTVTPRPALFLMSLIRLISPGAAFTMMMKQMAYKFQYGGPTALSELSQNKAVMEVKPCNMLNFPGGESLCILCQRETPIWLREQFKIETKVNRKENGCSFTFNPHQT